MTGMLASAILCAVSFVVTTVAGSRRGRRADAWVLIGGTLCCMGFVAFVVSAIYALGAHYGC